MNLLMKTFVPLLAVAAMLTAASLTQADDDKSTLDGVDLGEHVLGPEVTADDLKGKVVVFEYWGDKCGPCLVSIPGLVKVSEEYDAEKLAIVANQVWTKDADATKKAWKNAGGNDKISVVNHGALKATSHRGVPHAYVFDHKGKMIWHGNPHPRADGPAMKKTIKKAVANVPDQS